MLSGYHAFQPFWEDTDYQPWSFVLDSFMGGSTAFLIMEHTLFLN